MPVYRVSKASENGLIRVVDTVASSPEEAVQMVKEDFWYLLLRVNGHVQDVLSAEELPGVEDPGIDSHGGCGDVVDLDIDESE